MEKPSYDAVRGFLVTKLHEIASGKGLALEALEDEFNMIESGVLDSLAFVELLGVLEAEFAVEADLIDADPEEFVTLGGLARLFADT